MIDGGGIRASYDKRRLLPIVESAPSPWLVGQRALAFAPGDGSPVIDADGLTIAPLVCYEAIFPELARAAVRAGAAVLVNISNDAWLTPTAARQHFLFARLRAVEQRRALVRVANRGITAVVDPDGSARIAADGDEPGMLIADIPRLRGLTPYARVGDLFAWSCIAIVVTALIGAVARTRRVTR